MPPASLVRAGAWVSGIAEGRDSCWLQMEPSELQVLEAEFDSRHEKEAANNILVLSEEPNSLIISTVLGPSILLPLFLEMQKLMILLSLPRWVSL